MNVLAVGVLVAGVLGLDMESVSTKVITLSLQQVGGQVLGAVTVEPRQGSGEGGSRDTKLGGLGDNLSPAGLGLVDGLVEEVVEQQVGQVGLLAVGRGDVLEEDGADDAATTPHESNGGLVELPAVLLGSLLHEHEALGVGDDLGGVQGLLEVVKELLLVALELAAATADVLELGGGNGTLVLDAGQATGQDSLGDQGNGHTKVEGVDGSPLAGTLLAGLVEDLLNESGAIIVVEVHDVTGDLNEERVQDTLVPLGENVTNLLVGETETALHDVVGLITIVSAVTIQLLL